ncbi:MAG: UDP-N-acetylglucosamine 2-epimerase (hydrolyzing) [Chloroflexi bacterium]|nr:UDP-N-acetylglucosamine 2-epimerase (hydrolyzing) [Chloroflexota bacterium]
MRKIGIVTVGRSDLATFTPVIEKILERDDLQLYLYVSGAHLSPEFGSTAIEIAQKGWKVTDFIEIGLSSDTPQAMAKALGLGVISFAQVFSRRRPDILMVLGDRFEMLAAVQAAMPFNIPIAHIHGGDTTEGTVDEAIRHSITKMSHLHFAATEEYGTRILQMGEEHWRVTVTGSPALDNLFRTERQSKADVEEDLGIKFVDPLIMATFDSVTLEYRDTPYHVEEMLNVLRKHQGTVVMTYPEADTSGRIVINAIQEFAAEDPDHRVVAKRMGTSMFYSLLSSAAALVGNSSSGLIDAPFFKLPVVNIGNKQNGRVKAANVIDCGYASVEIEASLEKALSQKFRSGLKNMKHPYGIGKSAQTIVDVVASVPLDQKLIVKRFQDQEMEKATKVKVWMEGENASGSKNQDVPPGCLSEVHAPADVRKFLR